jgi:hypothetical protein
MRGGKAVRVAESPNPKKSLDGAVEGMKEILFIVEGKISRVKSFRSALDKVIVATENYSYCYSTTIRY